MTISILQFQNFSLVIAALVNLIMAVLIIFQGWRNKVNLYFSLLTFFNFLWAMGLFFGMTMDGYFGEWSAKIIYIFAIGIAISLLFFSVYFPYKIKKINPIFYYIILMLTLFFIFSTLNNTLVIEYYRDQVNNIFYLKHNRFLYILYSLYFISLMIFSIFNLIYKYKNIEGIFKQQILILLMVIVLGLIFGSYFDLFLCHFGIYKYEWLGPLFTLPMNFVQ